MRKPEPQAAAQADFAPRPRGLGTVLFLAGMWTTVAIMQGKESSEVAHFAAIGFGISLALSLWIDFKDGILNLIRADLLAIMALYFLTLFEFLFPQHDFDMQANAFYTKKAVIACAVGFSGLAIGRHLPNIKKHPLKQIFVTPTPKSWVMIMFIACVFLGSLNMLMAVNFNVLEMLGDFANPRFTQPWTRERLGDWHALLHELEMILELVPPIAGVIFGRRKKFPGWQLVIAAMGMLYVLYYGFSAGTRNVFDTDLVTFLIGYAFAMPPGKKKELIAVSGACVMLLVLSSFLMLQFREMGLKNYIANGYKRTIAFADQESMFIDYNLYSVCRIVEIFPDPQRYLGWEVPYLAIVRPVPRAVWPGKPEGLSFSLEEALGAEGYTVSASFVGESYMSHGFPAVFLAGIIFGAIMGWWSHLASSRNSELGILIYASGFLAAVISMRSLYVFTTAMLPTALAVVGGHFLVKAIRKKQQPRRPPMRRPAPVRKQT
jgi:hypothetical protein